MNYCFSGEVSENARRYEVHKDVALTIMATAPGTLKLIQVAPHDSYCGDH